MIENMNAIVLFALSVIGLGDDDDVAGWRQLHGGAQAGDAATHDHVIAA